MIPILYEKNETSFTSNGLCRLADCISCTVHEERNGVYECEFEYPVTGSHFYDIYEGRIIAVTHDETGDIQPFDIYAHEAPINGVVTFRAHHISYRQSGITVKPFTAESIAAALLGIKNNSTTTNDFTYWTDKSVSGTFAVTEPKPARALLCGEEGSILDVYGTAEYEFDRFLVKLHAHRGTDSGVTIRYGKNLVDLDDEMDYSDSYTGVVPYWIGTDENDQETMVNVDGWVVRSGSTSYGSRDIIIPKDMSDAFEDAPTAAQLRTAAESDLASGQYWLPNETINIDFVQLWQTEEYNEYAPLQRVKLCDTVSVYYPALNITIPTVKVIETTYNVLLDRYDEMVLGDARKTFAAMIQESVKSDVKGYMEESLLSQVMESINNLREDLEGQIDEKIETYYQATDPSTDWTAAQKAEHVGDLWCYTGVTTATLQNREIYRYNGTGWEQYDATEQLFDAIDAKTTIYYGTPSGSYPDAEVGDYLVDSTDGCTYRWNGSMWVKLTDYSSALTALQTALERQIDDKVETFYQASDPSTGWTAAQKTTHKGDLWYDTNSGKTYQWSGTAWQEMTADPPQSVFNTINGKANIFLGSTTPTGASAGDLWFKSASEPIYTYVNGSWQIYNKYTDDSAFNSWKLNEYAATITGINSDIADIQDQLDGNITQWFYTVDPAMNLPPVALDPQNPDSTGWDTDQKKQNHIGDLYYNTTNGHVWRWIYQNATYSWSRVQDSDVSRALELANEALDTADQKRRVFFATPTPPYDEGDLWAQGSNGDLMRCATPRAEDEPYDVSTDFVLASESLTNFIATTYADNLTALQQQIDGKIETWAQSTNPAANWTAAQKLEHTNDLWLYTGLTNLTVSGVTIKPQGVYKWSGSAWAAYSSTSNNLFDLADGKSTIYYGTPTGSYSGVQTGDYLVDSTDGCTYRWSGSEWQKVTDYQSAINATKTALETAIENATELITGGQGGYVYIKPNANDKPEEILIMNTDNINTATKVWRWNVNGLGYSSTGYSGTYGTAITMDGAIVADFITTGTLNANLIKAGIIADESGKNSWNMVSGAMVLRDATFYGNNDQTITKIGETLYMRNEDVSTDIPFIHLRDADTSGGGSTIYNHLYVFADALRFTASDNTSAIIRYAGARTFQLQNNLEADGYLRGANIYTVGNLGGDSANQKATLRYTTIASTCDISALVDSAMSTTSTKPVQNKVINTALQSKADATDIQAIQTDIQNIVSALNGKAPLASPAFSGNPTAPTQAAGNNSTRIATTAFVQAAISGGSGNYAPKNHASSATTYGLGTGAAYGHLKLSDSTTSSSSTSGGIAATPKAVKDAMSGKIDNDDPTVLFLYASDTSGNLTKVVTGGGAQYNIPTAGGAITRKTGTGTTTSSTSYFNATDTLNLSAGRYIFFAHVRFSAATTASRRGLLIYNVTAGEQIADSLVQINVTSTGGAIHLTTSTCLAISSAASFRARAMQNSGSDLNFEAQFKAIKIANY